MTDAMRTEALPLRTVVRHYLVAITSEGYAPTTIATNGSVLDSYARYAANGREPRLTGFTLQHVRE